MTDNNIAIKVENLSKYYRLGVINNGTLFRDIQSWLARIRGKEDPHAKIGSKYDPTAEGFWALKDLNFEIKKGDRVGIIGHNGAGKSTLLKLLSQITAPTEGKIKINGKIASLLEVGTGFHPEMTGRENIYMNGAILGMKHEEIDKKVNDIIEFSEIGKHIDTPVKRYSSGMYVRLAFAVAAHLDSDILIADEVLAVGDAAFQKKALGKMNELSTGEGRTVLFVSHNMAQIRALCNRGIVLEKGQIIFAGDIDTSISFYLNNHSSNLKTHYDLINFNRTNEVLGIKARFNSITILDKKIARFKSDEKIIFSILWLTEIPLENILINLTLKYADGTAIGFTECRSMLKQYMKGSYKTNLEFDISNLAEGLYFAYFHLSEIDKTNSIHDLDQSDKLYFEVIETSIEKTQWQRQYWGSVRLNQLEEIK